MIGGTVGDCEKRRLRTANLFQPDEISRRQVDPIVVVDIIADSEHRIGGSAGVRSLDQLNEGVSAAEVVGTVRANTAIIRAAGILQQWSNLQLLRGFI